jgi:hypothetical protein
VAYPDDVRDPDAMCALCGYVAAFSSVLEHLKFAHSPSEAQAVLVRPIAELRQRDGGWL